MLAVVTAEIIAWVGLLALIGFVSIAAARRWPGESRPPEGTQCQLPPDVDYRDPALD